MNRKYKHIIWDWNGTLFDDVHLCNDIVSKLLVKNGVEPLSLERYREVFTFPIRDYYIDAGFDFSKTPFEVLGKEFMDEYELRKTEASIFSNVKDILDFLEKEGLTQSIVSAYPQEMLDEFVGYFGIKNYFLGLAGLDTIYAHGKIDVAKRWLKNLDYTPEDIMFVGDTIHDFEVAQELGVNCILVASGHQSKIRLKDCGVPVFDSLENVRHYLSENGKK